ncbi:MAG: ABC transporter permease [Acidobacteria bacterium]|nr:ABC transporter permease [Acidobacteriota bacterium]
MRFRLREWWLRWRESFRHRDGSETEEELRFHLEMAEQDAVRRGQDAREARLRAGGVAQAAEAVRDQFIIPWLSDFLRDSRHGVRLLRRSPLFTAAAIVSLALGIGANTAIFTLIDAVLLRMMPVQEPGRLVQFGRDLSFPKFRHFRQELRCFTDMFAHSSLGRRDIIFDEDPEPASLEFVSGNYYSVLGVSTFAGRTFDSDIDRSPTAVAVISHAYWKRRFALDPSAIGRAFRWNSRSFTIIGIASPEFTGVVPGKLAEITLPLSMAGEVLGDPGRLTGYQVNWLESMGRLRAGYTIEMAQAEVATIYSRMIHTEAEQQKGNEFQRRKILAQRMPLEASGNGFDFLRFRFAEPLRLLMGIVALILLIACVNLANLLLGRATTRRREIAVRLAMGAGRGRVLRQMLAEGILLAAAAGILGVLLAWWSANALVTMMSNGGEPIALSLRPDLRVLAFAAAISAVACLLFSLAPAIQVTRHGIQPALAEARSGARWRWGRGLITAQVAISVLLVIGAGLFGSTLLRLYSLETGFHRDDVTLISVKTDRAGLQGHALRGSILESLRSMPGVATASFEMSPLSYKGWEMGARVEGYTYGPNEDMHVHVNFIAEDYFRTLSIPVIQGREFNERDTAASPKVVVVNEAFARRYFQGQSPLGKWLGFTGPDRMEIVGMVKDVRSRSLRGEIPAAVYVDAVQANRPPSGVYIVRGAGIAGIVDSALKRVDTRLRATDVRTLDEDLSRSILRERILGTLSGLFGALSLILVSVGVYGVMAFQVARRQKEIGIRMALGARPVQVTAMVLAETAVPVGAGVAVGVAGALGLTRLAEKMLYGVAPTDPVTFAGASGILILLALLAAYLPSRRAARMSPVETLRCD